MTTYKLSPSALNLMSECPRCFWLEKHGVWKRPAGIFPSLPSGMDGILKTHFDRFMAKGTLPPELSKINGYKLFNDVELLKVWRSNFKGIRWQDKEGNTLFGAIDNILVKGKKLVILDYKTRGFALKEDTADHYQNQLDIYNFLLRKNGYETESYGYLLFYVPKEVTEDGQIIFDTHLVKRDIDVKNAEKIWDNAISMLNKECPEEGCEWCKLVTQEQK